MNKITDIIKVGIADMNIVRTPNVIRTTGLGSCVGVVIYDLKRELAGMAHIMLPDSSLAKSGPVNIAKYADTAVKELFSILLRNGARTSSLRAKIAGGAQMFQFAGSDLMRIGPRNVEAVKMELAHLNIAIASEDVGGNSGRTIQFDPGTGILQIRTVNRGVHDI
ncbi:chemotaxis protein CheD [Bacillus sp. T33-2]|uniref:chemotaxis protein CheD n=1 Tax=Bacillus sp. T33-2 TaxID=2054168 RepID=UPI000C78638E|nr:chemotaxis protein CheD [Bacillus sp. T33-2]PLR97255.1 chemotaxis protein CheD [Bacillus sp. T33-2]